MKGGPIQTPRLGAWRGWGLRLALTALLLGCGGAGPDPPDEEAPPPPPPTVNTTVLEGLYQAHSGASNQEFISLVLPQTATRAQWYGWYFISGSADPYLYTGLLDLGENGLAQSTAIQASLSGAERRASVHLSQASAAGFSARVVEQTSQTALLFNASAVASTSYRFDQPPELGALAGTWSGTWSSEGGQVQASLGFGPNGALSTSTILANYCNISALRLSPSPAGNAFSASLALTGSTCPTLFNLPTASLSGVAVIHQVGEARQLELMLFDPAGRGISFRGIHRG